MRALLIAPLLAAALLAPVSANAQQTTLSINHVVTHNLPHHQCMRRAADTLREARLRQFDTTLEAVWGNPNNDNRYTVGIYCLTTRDVAVVVASGFDGRETARLVEDVIAAWNRTR